MELSIDTASEMASVALSREGSLIAEITWRCRRTHTVELLPTIDKLLAHVGASKHDLTAVFVCVGPGMYTGLRVGVSTAKGLAYALGLAIVGVGRLELDAYPHATYPGPVVPLHSAGRGELAWAVYEGGCQMQPPRLSSPQELLREAPGQALFCGEISPELAQAISRALPQARIAQTSLRRAATLAQVAYRCLAAGQAVDPAAVRAVYLREPVVGPQTPSP